ncbi:retrovirus-related pol polyprotein from transposon TNT 1-94 [Tanacetum coccineum]
MDLCGLMHVASVNGKKYILVIMDDYSRFTWIRTDNGTEFVNQTLREYYESVDISHETSVAHTPQQNRVVERRNRTLVEAARTMLIYLLHDKKPDLSYFHVFGALCYPTNDSENLGKLQAKADIGIFIAMASEQSSLGPALHEMTPVTSSSGLVPNPPSPAPFVPPTRNEWDLMFQPLFDEFYSPPPSVGSPAPADEIIVPAVKAQVNVESTGSPSSTTVDQDAPSKKENHDLEVAHMSNDPFFGIPIPDSVSEESSSLDVIPIIVHLDTPNPEHLSK